MVDTSVKIENYTETFVRTMLADGDRDQWEAFINAYSYFISKTNKNYKYNLTYLPSYFEEFMQVKEAIKKKENIAQSLQVLLKKKELCTVDKMKVSIDRFWTLIKEDSVIRKKYAGELDIKRIMSDMCMLEIEIETKTKKREKINITQKVSADNERIEDDIKQLMEQLNKVLELGSKIS